MAKLTAQQIVKKQADRLKSSTTEMANQVRNVTEAPGIAAAKNQQKLVQNWNNAVTSGRWAKRVSSVSLDSWQKSMIEKGIPRVAQGIDAAAPKVEAFFNQFLPHLDKVEAELKAMPSLTLEDNIQRMVHVVRRNSEFKLGK